MKGLLEVWAFYIVTIAITSYTYWDNSSAVVCFLLGFGMGIWIWSLGRRLDREYTDSY